MESKGHQDEQKNDEFMNGQKEGGALKHFFRNLFVAFSISQLTLKLKSSDPQKRNISLE